jgi:hypothetical protein
MDVLYQLSYKGANQVRRKVAEPSETVKQEQLR